MKSFKSSFLFSLLLLVSLSSCFGTEEVSPNIQWGINTNPSLDVYNTHDSILGRHNFRPIESYEDTQNFTSLSESEANSNISDKCAWRDRTHSVYRIFGLFASSTKVDRKVTYGATTFKNIRQFRTPDGIPIPNSVLWKAYPTEKYKGILVFTISEVDVSDTIFYTISNMAENFNMNTDKKYTLFIKYQTSEFDKVINREQYLCPIQSCR